jgi:hypothetical protein
MKPVVIIAIAVVCSVVAVFGILMGLQEMQISNSMNHMEQKQMSIVNKYNNEIQRCGTDFEYGNVPAKQQCEENAKNNFDVFLLDDTHMRMMETSITSEEHMMYSNKILEAIERQNEEYFEQYP